MRHVLGFVLVMQQSVRKIHDLGEVSIGEGSEGGGVAFRRPSHQLDFVLNIAHGASARKTRKFRGTGVPRNPRQHYVAS